MIFGSLKFAHVLLLQTLSHFPEEVAYDVDGATEGVTHGRGEEQKRWDTRHQFAKEIRLEGSMQQRS